jgi:hypothetical protein
MSIEQEDVVDAVGIEKKTSTVTLAISDHLDWSDEHGHLLMLQSKINTYLRFLESGEIYDHFPKAKGKRCIIEIVGECDPTESARGFLKEAETIVEGAGFGLRFRKLETDND